MKILLIYENSEKSNANYYANLFIEELNKHSNNIISKIYLNSTLFNDLLYTKQNFIKKCYSSKKHSNLSTNMIVGFEYLHFIISQIESSNLIIFIPSEKDSKHKKMKCLLEMLSSKWMPHKYNKNLFNKIGIILSYKQNSACDKYIKTMKYDLLSWGLKSVIQIDLLKYNHIDYDLNLLKLKLIADKIQKCSQDLYFSKCFFFENIKNNITFNKCKLKFIITKSKIFRNLILNKKNIILLLIHSRF